MQLNSHQFNICQNYSNIQKDQSMNSEQSTGQPITESSRSQNFSDDPTMTDLKNDQSSLPTEEDYSLVINDQDIKKVHVSFMKHIKIIFTVVICVFMILSILVYLLVIYLQQSHGDHYFDVEPFQTMHTLFNSSVVMYNLRQQPRKWTPPVNPQIDKYEFQLPIPTMIKYSHFNTNDSKSQEQVRGIKKTTYMRAARLMDLVHNVNFYGEYVFDHFNYFSSPKQKAQYFTDLLAQERAYLNSKYQIDKYIHDQIRMCVFVPSYNNAQSRLYLRNLDSIFQQNYKNYHVVYVNDASTDGTGEYVQAYMQENYVPPEKYTIINNNQSLLHCANIYQVAHNHCNEGQILVMLDGDDSLIGRDVFAVLNAVYQKQKVGLTYGQFILVRKNAFSTGWSKQIPQKPLEEGKFRNLKDFFTSHLKTMYVDLFRKINVKDLQHSNGTFFRNAPDVAYMTPAIQMVGPRLAFINEPQYEYRFDTGMNEVGTQQSLVSAEVFQKKPYNRLESMEFADNPKVTHYDEV